MQRVIYEADAMQSSYTSQVVSDPALVNGLSSPAMTLSHSGHALARISSSSDLSFSSRFPVSVSASTFLCPPPMPGIHPAGAVITATSASGIMRSRRRSPAESRLRPNELVGRLPFCGAYTKFGPFCTPDRMTAPLSIIMPSLSSSSVAFLLTISF